MKKLTKCARKLKKVLKCLQRDSNSKMVNYSVSSPSTVTCEELFLSSGVQNGHRRNDNHDHDPFLAANIAAQNHFTLKPNIYEFRNTYSVPGGSSSWLLLIEVHNGKIHLSKKNSGSNSGLKHDGWSHMMKENIKYRFSGFD
ncbi:hypothetical protein SADUNF_Sadunf14G0121500 [Salix dunnii]|uniref:Uncharacterized protein n=1 Tax=Salix dunnii TaxID=1413687 RepID=A0A835JE80_9ROSI|nr:hypothetical protein SADUNF_Sadunf14G0121500 [Salix dunnii]